MARQPDAPWRGFNLIDMFSTSVRWKEVFPMNDGLVLERDFEMISALGFNFVRIPMSYLFFAKGAYGREIDESRLWLIDRAVEFGRKYGIHVLLAFHRAPGYCVTGSSYFDFPERSFLFTSEDDQELLVRWWRTLAGHFKDVPAAALSFNLLNEPANIDDETYCRIFQPILSAIRAVSPDRPVHVEGAVKVHSLEDFTLEQSLPPPSIINAANMVISAHIYSPLTLTHYDTPYIPSLPLEPPTWPYTPRLKPGARLRLMGENAMTWDKQALRDHIAPFGELAAAGHKVHVGEFGAYSKVPHAAFLGWVGDLLDVLGEFNIGWTMWNFRGPFGVLDSGRSDVAYENWNGHALDRRLLDLLTSH